MAESLKVLFCNQDLDLEFCNAKVLSLGSSSSTTAARASERELPREAFKRGRKRRTWSYGNAIAK
jgi:hypothetical protein